MGLCVSRLIIAVADVDTLHIIDKRDHAIRPFPHGFRGVGDILHVCIGKVADVVICGSERHVPQPGIHRLAGRVHFPVEDFAQRVETRCAGTGAQQDAADLVIFLRPAHFQRVGAIVDHDHIVEIGADHIHQISLGLAQFQIRGAGRIVVIIPVVCIAGPCVLGAFLIGTVHNGAHIVGQVRAFAAAAGNHNQCGVGKRLRVVQNAVRVGVHRGFRQSPLLTVVDGNGGPVRTVVHIQFSKFAVQGKPGVFQTAQKRDRCGGVHSPGTGSAVDRVRGGPAEHVQICHAVQREQSRVLRHDDALAGYRFADVLGILDRLRGEGSGFRHGGRHKAPHRPQQNAVDQQAHCQNRRDNRLDTDETCPLFSGSPCQNQRRDHCNQHDRNANQPALNLTDYAEDIFPCNRYAAHPIFLLNPIVHW